MFVFRKMLQPGSLTKTVKRGISFEAFSKSDMESILNARKHSQTFDNQFKTIEASEKTKHEWMSNKAKQIENRAKGPDGYLHPEFTQENIKRVMLANKPDLTIKKSIYNTYEFASKRVSVVDPQKPDMLSHELQHHIDDLNQVVFSDITKRELSAFKTQEKVARELKILPNMPGKTPEEAAETYRNKSQSRYDEKKM